MELGEGEAKICRLCGQCESIYIDVFGEEGTKRFLGLKIYTKINILIDERDPLPKAICVQCLGKLEFVCDFQEECLRTQQVLRDRYNLPPLSEIAEIKTEDTTPSTSTNNNNNDIDKNLNSPNERTLTEVEHISKTATKAQRNLRSQQQTRDNEEAAKDQNNIQSTSENNIEDIQTIESPETTPTRWLRSRQNTETTTTNEITNIPIANRLRSHNSTATEVTINSHSSSNESIEKQNGKQQDSHIQIPTSALNKLLTIVSSSPNIEVSVKESRHQSNDVEDISFTVELCKKESDDVATVRARVFPDQGSCLVDKDIVDLLQSQSCVEVNSIINTIITSSLKNGSSTKSKDSAEFEQKWQASQNPEELFKIDGEEIRVDDNVEHVVSDSQNGYSCKLCCKFYERKDKCMVHVKTHLGIKQYTCILCNAKFVCKSDVMKHIRCSHTNPRPIQCPKCPKRFKSKFYLMEHDNVHKGVRPYSCTDCGQSYHHKVSLQIHMKSHLPPQNLACEYCGKVFPYRTRLLSHVASVHLKNRRNFRCRFCYNLYSSLAVLNEHIKTRHATTYTCEVCSKTFKVASKYKAHVLQHSNPKPFVCSICNNRYASKAFLNEHLLKHEGLRKHICQKCGARFAQASHLAAHRHVHGEKKHACPECGRKFNRRDNMKVHRKRHFEDKKTGIIKQKNVSNTDATSTASNEKIKENDGLPQIVCLRCLGTLEFLCDFYDHCHLTQKELSKAVENEDKEKLQEENETESDKENTAPSVNRKAKPSSPVSSKVIKKCTTKNLYCRTEKTNDNNFRRDNSDCTNNVQPVMSESLVSNNQSAIDTVLAREKNSKNEQNNDTKLKCRTNFIPKEDDVIKNTMNRVTNTHSINLLRKNEENVNANSVYPVKRKRGRKSNAEKMRNASLLNRENIVNTKNDGSNNKCKRYCQRNNATESTVISPKPQVEQVTTQEQVAIDILSKQTCIKDNGINTVHSSSAVPEKQAETKPNDESLKKTEDNSLKSKAISVIVKQEKTESGSAFPKQNEKLNQLTWIPSEILMQENVFLMDTENVNQVDRQETEVLRGESPLGKETNEVEGSKVTSTMEHDATKYPNSSDHEQNRVTVIKSSLSNEVTAPKIIDKGPLELFVTADTTNQSTEGDLESSLVEQLLLQQHDQSGSCDESSEQRKNKDKFFVKISELISDEEKQAIEEYYTVDMSIVNSEEVQKNLTIVDKKNIRCNICGILYLRIDKCQVHIWGHLQMKPYQCKACDFSTVTVTNIRGHIRKSHLKIKPFSCDVCGKRYATAFLLEEHMNMHTGARPYKCKLCDFTTSRKQMLNYHDSTHKIVKDINCKICGKEFFSRGRLRAHMIVHNKDKVLICKLCSAYLSNPKALETHHKNIHMQEYICNICGKRLKSKKALHNHQNVHTVGKYKCTLCPNVYKSRQILKEHLLKHKGIRNYKCNVCEKAFGQQSHLAAHMAVHSKIRYHCPGCDRPFNRHDNMKIHTKRCKVFLANPDLKNIFIKRERYSSFTKITELEDDTRGEDVSLPISSMFIESQNSDTQEKTALNFCKLGLNISCIEPVDQTWNRVDLYETTGEMTSTEINVIQITQVGDKLIPENENLTVLENVLRPESY